MKKDYAHKYKVEFTNIEAVNKFTSIVSNIDGEVRIVAKDENGEDWDISAKSILCSLLVAANLQTERKHTAHEVDWNTTWCCSDEDIYSKISEFVVVD